MRKNRRNKLNTKSFFSSMLLVIFCLLFLTGCPRVLYLTIIDTTDPAYPVICVSMKKNCRGDEVSFGQSFSIYEVNEEGQWIKEMWIIRAVDKNTLKKIKYGSVPEGWSEKQKAIPLELGKTYYVEEENFFTLKYENGQVKAEVEDLRDFSMRARQEQK